MISLIGVSVLLAFTSAANLPSAIVPCKDDAKLNECALINGNKALPILIKGDPKHKLPVLDPMRITKLSVTDGGTKSISINLTFTDLDIYGLKDVKFVKSEMDTKKKVFIWHAESPTLKLLGKYKVSGKILLLPITGEGPMELHLTKPKYNFAIHYELFQEKGETYAKIIKTDLKYDIEHLSINLQNLFNGDKTLGDNMNTVLNDNWKELSDQLGGSIAEALNQVGKQLVENIIKGVPFENIIKP